jgi:hypothetical protein
MRLRFAHGRHSAATTVEHKTSPCVGIVRTVEWKLTLPPAEAEQRLRDALLNEIVENAGDDLFDDRGLPTQCVGSGRWVACSAVRRCDIFSISSAATSA